MKRKKEKTNICISIDKKLNEMMDSEINNKSKYIEWLIYQDLKKSGLDLEKIII